MKSPFKTPEQMLAYRPLKQVLAGKPPGAYGVGPNDSVFSALQLMAAKGTGFVVVQENDHLVGVFSERDYARKVILMGLASKETPVRIVMTQKVVTVSLEQTSPQCMTLMNENRFRHLPVVHDGKLIGVLSVGDIVKEILAHHERLIRDFERERMTTLNPGSSY
jgi:CBS domain-containing protein